MTRNIRFGLVLNEQERQALEILVDLERTTAAAVIRRLIWLEADKMRNRWPQSNTQEEVGDVNEFTR